MKKALRFFFFKAFFYCQVFENSYFITCGDGCCMKGKYFDKTLNKNSCVEIK